MVGIFRATTLKKKKTCVLVVRFLNINLASASYGVKHVNANLFSTINPTVIRPLIPN